MATPTPPTVRSGEAGFSLAEFAVYVEGEFDVYIPDAERLAEQHACFLREHPEFRDKLRTQFAKAYSDKFGWRRYERLPELMRLQREKAGMDRINELFG